MYACIRIEGAAGVQVFIDRMLNFFYRVYIVIGRTELIIIRKITIIRYKLF